MKKLLPLLLLMLCHSPAWGAVAFDSCANATGDGLTTLTISGFAMSGSNVMILASTAWVGSPSTTSGVEWNPGAAMTLVNEQSISNRSLSLWKKALGNSPGTHDIVFSFNTTANRIVTAVCAWTGVDQVTPLGTAATSTDYTGAPVSLTLPANGALFNVAADYDQTPAVAAQTTGQTKRFDAWVDSGSGVNTAHFGATRGSTGAMTWTSPGGEFEAQIGVPINPVSATATPRRKAIVIQ